MEKRQRLALLVVLTRYNRWLESQGVIKTSGVGDRLLARYMRELSTAPEERPTKPADDAGPSS